jgi:hypothetical protein
LTRNECGPRATELAQTGIPAPVARAAGVPRVRVADAAAGQVVFVAANDAGGAGALAKCGVRFRTFFTAGTCAGFGGGVDALGAPKA